MAALQFVHVPGYAALLLRRTFPDLAQPGALIPRSFEWLSNTGAQWSSQRHTWTFPSGATVGFGYLAADNDVYQYQSSEFQFCGFDELTQFTEFQYTYMFSRLRKPDIMRVPLRMRAGTNPGGTGHVWVRDRFIRDGHASGRVFIPSALSDNPHTDQEAYTKSLNELDHITRAQLKDGNWDVMAGGRMFKRIWFEIVEPEQVPDDVEWCRAWDMAASKAEGTADPDWTAGAKIGLHRATGTWYLADMRHERETPGVTDQLQAQTAQLDGRNVMIREELEGGSSGLSVVDKKQRTIFLGYNYRGSRPETNKIARAKPVSAAAEHGHFKVVRGPWNAAFLDEIELFPQKGVHDDQVDATSLGMRSLSEAGKVLYM